MIPEFNIWLCTLRDVQDWQLLENTDADWTPLQVRLIKMFIRQASQQAATWLGQIPLPYLATHTFDFSPEYVTPDYRTLILDAPLLSATTLTNGDSSAIAASSYVLKENNRYPKRYVEIKQNSTVRFRAPSNGNTSQVISLAGEYGYVPHYGRHWRTSGIAVPESGLNDSATTLTLTNTDAFQVGDYLRIDSETLLVEDKTTTVLTLQRAQLGTVAAAHSEGASMQIFVQLEDIRTSVAEWAAYLYKSRDRLGESVQIFDRQTTVVNQLSPLVRLALGQHRSRKLVQAG